MQPFVSTFHRRFSQSILMAGLSLLPWMAAQAQPAAIDADRPQQTQSPFVISPRVLQAEVGWQILANDDRGVDAQLNQFPDLLVRIGVIENLEVRLGWNGLLWSRTKVAGVDTNLDGHGDGSLGGKYHLLDENGLIPATAFSAEISLPFGDDDLSTDEVDPSFRFAMQHTITDRLSLNYNLGAKWVTTEAANNDDVTEGFFVYTVSTVASLTQKIDGFVELFGDVPFQDRNRPRNHFDGGLTWQCQSNVQLDMFVGAGISNDAADWFFGLGLTYRYPN